MSIVFIEFGLDFCWLYEEQKDKHKHTHKNQAKNQRPNNGKLLWITTNSFYEIGRK